MSTKKICKAKKSKRQGTKERVKKDLKIRASKRKMKKEAKNLKKLGIVKYKSNNNELRIPNLYPFKKQLLEQLKNKKDGEKRAVELANKDASESRAKMLSAAIASQNENADDKMQIEDIIEEDFDSKRVKNNLKPLRYIFDNADVVIEVLDARDPEGCRSRKTEQQFIAEHPDKKLILVLNKIDLVPLEIAKKWKRVLSREFPTVLFKSNLQEQTDNLSSNKLYNKSIEERTELANELISSSKSVGAEKLMEIIKNYSRTGTGDVSSIVLGVLGFPNVGKSSLINSLTKRRVVGVSSVAGYTKTI